jgi:hypothetical protein
MLVPVEERLIICKAFLTFFILFSHRIDKDNSTFHYFRMQGSFCLRWGCFRFCITALPVSLVCLGECLGITYLMSGIAAGPDDDWRMHITGDEASKALSDPPLINFPPKLSR